MFLIVHFIIHIYIYIHTRIIRINTHTQDAYTSSYIYIHTYMGGVHPHIYICICTSLLVLETNHRRKHQIPRPYSSSGPCITNPRDDESLTQLV